MKSTIEHLMNLRENGRGREELLAEMKRGGLTITQAIKTSMVLFDVGLGEAKSIVTVHPAWRGEVRAAEPLHDTLCRPLRDVGTRGKKGTPMKPA